LTVLLLIQLVRAANYGRGVGGDFSQTQTPLIITHRIALESSTIQNYHSS